MTDHVFYIVSAYAAWVLALIWEFASLRRHRARALEQVRQAIEEAQP
jgi:heme exporter protein D